MRCNFTIDQSVGLQSDFGYLDVHNCYDLVGIAFDKHQVRLSFTANEHNSPDLPEAFVVELDELSEFEGHVDASSPDAFDIDEVSFRAHEDRNLDLSVPSSGTPNLGNQLAIRFVQGYLRIGALTADVKLG